MKATLKMRAFGLAVGLAVGLATLGGIAGAVAGGADLSVEELTAQLKEIENSGRLPAAWYREGEEGRFIESLTGVQLRGVLREYKKLYLPHSVPSLVADRLGELERRAAAEFLLKENKSLAQRVLPVAVAAWARVDLDGAFKWALEQDGGPDYGGRFGNPGMRAVLEMVLLHFPERADEFFEHKKLKSSPERREALPLLGSLRCGDDPEAWTEWRAGLSKQDQREVLPAQVSALAPVHPEIAAKVASKIVGLCRAWNLQAVAAAWARRDPLAALEWVRGEAPAALRDDLKLLVLLVWVEIDASACWEHISALPSEVAIPLLQRETNLHRQSYTQDPSQPSWYDPWRYAGPKTQPSSLWRGKPDGGRPRIEHRVVASHGYVTKFTDSLGALLVSRLGTKEMWAYLKLTDPNRPASLAVGHLTSEGGASSIRGRFFEGRTDPQAALEYVRSEAPENTALIERGAKGIARTDPVAALKLAETIEGTRTFSVIGTIVRAWGEHEPFEADAYMEALPDGKWKEEARKAMRGIWMQAAPEPTPSPKSYLDEEPGEKRNRAFASYIAVLDSTAVDQFRIAREIEDYLKAEKVEPHQLPLRMNHRLLEAWVDLNPESVARFGMYRTDNWRTWCRGTFIRRWNQFGEGIGEKRLEELGFEEKISP